MTDAGQVTAQAATNGVIQMRPYMIYSRLTDPAECALLVIAHTARKARSLAWRCGILDVDSYIDLVAKWLRDDFVFALADQEKLASGIPHVVDSPVGCESCGLWGTEVKPHGECCHCGGNAGELLTGIMERWRDDI